MKKHKNEIILGIILLLFFCLGFLAKSLTINKTDNIEMVADTEFLIRDYSKMVASIDSIEKLSMRYYDTANIELLHYAVYYEDLDSCAYSGVYVTHFGDTVVFNKTNFFYYVALYNVAENLLETRKHIINGLIINNTILETDKIRNKIYK